MSQRVRRGLFGLNPVEVGLWAAGFVLMLGITIAWDLLLVEPISSMSPNQAQANNKYFLFVVVAVVALVFTVISMALAARRDPAVRAHPVANFCVRLGIALQLFGLATVPVGLFYATNPTRSVPVGFAYFTAAFMGLFLAGFAGNALAAARRA